MFQQVHNITYRLTMHCRNYLHAPVFFAVMFSAPPSIAAAQSEDAPPPASLHFTLGSEPTPLKPPPAIDPARQSKLNFDSVEAIDFGQGQQFVHQSQLQVLSELMLIRARTVEDPQPDTVGLEAIEKFSLRFEDASSDNSLWSRADEGITPDRWEVLPALYLRSGQILDEGYESTDYADLYAELGVDLSSNTGLWLRYERLRQALGNSREGEQVDADALYLQFELRF